MELIAPAGSWAGMEACVESGADAVYLGLQDWNARNRAPNFSLNTFRDACAWCHERGRRVYLTLNTLLRDSELSTVLSLLTTDSFTQPDAIIVSDVGLMNRLRQSLPMVNLHASTQFGTHSVDDLGFLEGLGIRRAVLARELSLTEISHLARRSKVELEVFAWGSQCMGISGDCTLSGLLLGGSGDRGRCLGPCRDIHRAPGVEGQLLYPRDMDIGSDYVRRLMECGVAALKVEGRMRSPDALADIVSRLRGQIDGLQTAPSGAPTASFLSGILPVPGFARTNPPAGEGDEQSSIPLLQPSMSGERSLKAKWNFTYPVRLGAEPGETIKSAIDRISFLDQISFDRPAASVAVVVEQGTIIEVDCVDAGGCRKKILLPISGLNSSQVTLPNPAALAQHVRFGLKELSIYEFSVIGDTDGAICVDLQNLLLQIRSAVSPLPSSPPTCHEDGSRPSLAVETYHKSHIRHFLDRYDLPIVVQVQSFSQIARVIKSYGGEGRIIFRLPEMDWKSSGLVEIMDLIRGHGVMITRLRQLPIVNAFNPPFIEADYTIDCWNEAALAFVRERGVRRIAITPEWSPDDALAFGEANHFPVETIVAGRLTALITRHCWSETLGCKGRCKSWQPIRNVEKGYGLRLHCEAPGIRRLIFEEPLPIFGLRPNAGTDLRCRYVATYDSMEEIANTMGLLTAPVVRTDKWQTLVASHPGWTSRMLGSVK